MSARESCTRRAHGACTRRRLWVVDGDEHSGRLFVQTMYILQQHPGEIYRFPWNARARENRIRVAFHGSCRTIPVHLCTPMGWRLPIDIRFRQKIAECILARRCSARRQCSLFLSPLTRLRAMYIYLRHPLSGKDKGEGLAERRRYFSMIL